PESAPLPPAAATGRRAGRPVAAAGGSGALSGVDGVLAAHRGVQIADRGARGDGGGFSVGDDRLGRPS
ncbi:hypothetical protein, partial [Marinitenerispora sediminis]|uniref:hypothetical protein n=1 Tax=Marinitenerispora sediminis TaxID=1931232 RepID=UPI001C6A4A4E